MTATGPRRNGTRAASWIVAAAVLWTAAPNAAAWAAPDNGSVAVARAKIFDNLARRIMKGFRGPQGTLRELGLLGSGRRRVAVLPFDADKIPVPEALAVEFHEDFIAALTRAAQGSIVVIQRQNLPAMIRDSREFGTAGNTVNAIIRKARADALIRGRIGRNGDVVKLSFQAFNSGDANAAAIIASTGSHEVPVTVAELEGMKVRLGLDQVINAAARYFTGKFSDMSELRLGGIRYQGTGIQPRLGRYLEDRLKEAFTKAHRGALTGSLLIVRRAEGRVRGIETAAKPIRPEIAGAGPGVYVLTGSYWPFGQAVELRLQLTDRHGGSELWSGRIRPETLPSLRLRPDQDFGRLRENDGIGPIGLSLSSLRGKDPVYRIGEKLNLLIGLDRDTWVYCFYRQVDGMTFKIFPNRLHANGRLAGGRVHTVPGETMPFDFHLTPPAGVELVKCFATSRDVTAELPRALQGLEHRALPLGMEWRLPTIFRRFRTALSEASLVITLTE